ncbi:MAG TPA: helix-turn-helix domain-containing protein, partial [Fibrobacteria bacterium]|nr:helix-turn-helix domain-containing protein [Fibrobacteria bacterium]
MSDESNGTAPEGREGSPKGSAGETGIGKTLREARAAANIDVNKVCTDLRIAPQALEALEQGNYHLLPGDPYIRALLGSLGRYLNLDPGALVQGYNKEIGAVHAAPSIAPYKDRTQTHTAAHKQIFIGIFAALFIVLFLLFRKLGTDDSDVSKAAPPMAGTAATDTLAPASQDTALESKSLAPDSSQAKASPDSGETRGLGAKGALKPITPPGAPAAPGAPAPAVKPALPGNAAAPT